jgi:hypothetical protein
MDVKKFWIYVHTTKVKKGWDWVELPDGRRISVPEGKYVKVMTIGNKTAIGFEDLTEEIGEKPDWDYQTPMCIVDEEVDGVQKVAKLRCRFNGRYHVSLFYEGVKVAEFWWGKTFEAPSFSYLDVQALAQQLPIAPAPAVPAMPVFDYIIDIYSDKVVIKSHDGFTTTLTTIADLNEWLSNNKGKRIAIYAYTDVTEDIDIYSGEYWFIKGFFDCFVGLHESNTTIVNVGAVIKCVYNMLDVSNVTVASCSHTTISFYNVERGTGIIVVGLFQVLYIENFEARVFAEVFNYAEIWNCRLLDLSIKARLLKIYDTTIEESRRGIVIETEYDVRIDNVTNKGIWVTKLNIRREIPVYIDAGTTMTIDIPNFGVPGYFVSVEYFSAAGVAGVTYTIDTANHVIRITNNTTTTVGVFMVIRVTNY